MKAQLEELTLIIFTMLEQRSIGTQVVQRYLSPVALSRSTDLESDVHSYSDDEVTMAEEEGLPLIDPRTNNTESVADVIGPGYRTKKGMQVDKIKQNPPYHGGNDWLIRLKILYICSLIV